MQARLADRLRGAAPGAPLPTRCHSSLNQPPHRPQAVSRAGRCLQAWNPIMSTAPRCLRCNVQSPAQQHTPATAGMLPGPPRSDVPAPVLRVRDLTFHPASTPATLLKAINMDVPAHSLGLIIGRSGSGKTTLLQVLAGLCEQTSGTVHIMPPVRQGMGGTPTRPRPDATSNNGAHSAARANGTARGARFAARMAAENRGVAPLPSQPTRRDADQPTATPPLPLPAPATMEERMAAVGLVFQFPERHFLGSDVFTELTFAWPRTPGFMLQQQALQSRVMRVLQAVRLADIDMRLPPRALSGGQQRRLALAIQLIRQPSVLVLDEPLAGLDWQARQEVVELLQRLKQECSLLVVSHDLREVSSLVDCAWVMRMGGTMEALDTWPPPGGFKDLGSTVRMLQ